MPQAVGWPAFGALKVGVHERAETARFVVAGLLGDDFALGGRIDGVEPSGEGVRDWQQLAAPGFG